MSDPQIPQAFTRTSTSSSAIWGIGTSSSAIFIGS